jgi:phasin family protein
MFQFSPEQFATAQKSYFDTFFALGGKVFEGVEKLTTLNLQAGKSIFGETQETVQKALSEKDPQNLLALQSALARPAADKAQAYSRHVYEILVSTQAEFVKVADAQVTDYKRSTQTFIDNVVKNAPAGSETAVGLLSSAVAAANTTYETVSQATKRAVEVAESNFAAATTAASNGAKHATAQAASTAKAG